MTFLDLLKAVKDENLDKQQLEDYHKALSELRGEMKLELAANKKRRAMFMLQNPELSVAQRKLNWEGTPDGQREIDLKGYIGAASDNLSSLKSRLFSIY